MSCPLERLEIWLAVGSQDLYSKSTLTEVDADARTVAAELDRAGETEFLYSTPQVLGDVGDRTIRLEVEADRTLAQFIGVTSSVWPPQEHLLPPGQNPASERPTFPGSFTQTLRRILAPHGQLRGTRSIRVSAAG